ncbi:MAG: hypothetical protein VX210_14980 [Myxococcota bacterium]|nr:hypothetical protein [Myxococcota bacterium]
MLRPSIGEGRIEVGGLARHERLLRYALALGLALGFSVVAKAEAEVFRASELSKGDWNSPGYAFELSLSSFSSSPIAKRRVEGYGFRFAPSYLLNEQIRLGLDLSYHFLRKPIGGIQNALRVWGGWDLLPWHQVAIGAGFSQEQRNYDVTRNDIPQWIRTCRRVDFFHVFQRYQFFWDFDSDFRWGPGMELMAGNGFCQSENLEKKWRGMWAGQLFFTFAWR